MIEPAQFEKCVPEQLKAKRRWVGWTPDPKSGRPKCPVIMSAKERRASSRKPETWGEFRTAQAFLAKYGDGKTVGVGFVFTLDDGLLYADVDDALDATGELRDWAKPFVSPFIGRAYIETSPSGRGLHIIGAGTLPGATCGGKANFPAFATGEKVPEVALFAHGKYTTVTGNIWKGNVAIDDCTAAAAQVWQAAGIQTTAVDMRLGAAPADAELPQVDGRAVPRGVKAELKECTAADMPDRSAARFKLYTEAAKGGLTPEEVFALVLGSEWYTASGAQEKGREQTWADICRCVAKADTAQKEFEAVKEVEQERAKSTADDWRSLGIAVRTEQTKEGPIYRAVYGAKNMATVLSRHPDWAGRLKMNVFKERMELDGKPFEDEALIDMAEFVRSYLRWDTEPNLALVFSAALRASRDYAFNPLQDYLNGLAWDGASRIDGWLARAGCEDTPLNKMLGRKWLISIVARALDEGCKCDTVLILEGAQGQKKSSILHAIAGGGEYFTDSHVTFDKDGLMVMHGHWVIEIAELSTFQQAERERTKQFVSGRDLTFRPPYARTTRTFKRHFVLTGSTNELEEYMNDPTGERRYWPVRVAGKLDVAWVEENRDQLLAEAVAAFKAKEPWWFEDQPVELTEAHAERTVQDPLRGKVVEFIEQNPGLEFEMSSLMEFSGLPVESVSLSKRLGVILRGLGYACQRRRVGDRRKSLWRDLLFGEDDGDEEGAEALAS